MQKLLKSMFKSRKNVQNLSPFCSRKKEKKIESPIKRADLPPEFEKVENTDPITYKLAGPMAHI